MKSTRQLCIVMAIVSICLFSSHLLAKDGAGSPNFIAVVLDDTENLPIRRAHIWIHEDTGKASFTAQPDSSGQFAAQLPNGYYDVLFSGPGYAPFCKKIWVEPGKITKLKIHLAVDINTSVAD
jgi:hypothetical protein